LTTLRDTVFGLQCKATVLLVTVMLVVTTLLCGFAVEKSWLLAGRLGQTQAIRQAAIVAKSASEPMWAGDIEALEHLAEEWIDGDGVWFIQFTGVGGGVLAAAEARPGLMPSKPHPGVDAPVHRVRAVGRGHYLDVRHAVIRPGAPAGDDEETELLGFVRLGVSRDYAVAAFKATADVFIIMAAVIVAMSVPLSFMAVRRIVVPLNAMSRTARRFSSGDLSARTDVRRSDEIGVLAANFNALADEVERKHRENVALNAKLEERVMERTAQLRELAIREPLTGLYNRRHFSEVLARRFSEARRYGNDLSLAMIDVDDFKGVNDALGHQAGDDVLIQTAQIITSQLRAADVAARFGGDEFIILLPQSNGEQARRVVDRIVERFCREVRKNLEHVEATLSVGVASLAETGVETDEEFIRAADRAMYDAKTSGKDRVVMAAAIVQ